MCDKDSRLKRERRYDWMDYHSTKFVDGGKVRWAGIWYTLRGQSCPLSPQSLGHPQPEDHDPSGTP